MNIKNNIKLYDSNGYIAYYKNDIMEVWFDRDKQNRIIKYREYNRGNIYSYTKEYLDDGSIHYKDSDGMEYIEYANRTVYYPKYDLRINQLR